MNTVRRRQNVQLPKCVCYLVATLWILTATPAWSQNPDPLSDPFIVQLTGDNRLSEAAVDASGQGHFVAVWTAYSNNPMRSRMRAQRLDIDGNWIGPELLVAFEPSGAVMAPDVGLSANGDFLIVWDQGSDIKAQRYHVSGSPIGGEIQVNAFSTGEQFDSDVAVHGSGSFVVTWSSRAADGQILAQRFDSSGQFLGEPLTVAPIDEDTRQQSRIAMDEAGDFVVVWQVHDPGESWQRIEGRRYGSDGQPQGETFQVSPPEWNAADRPAVTRHADGRFVIAWSDALAETTGRNILARRFDRSALPLGDTFRVNTDTTEHQIHPRLVLEEGGGFQVVWLRDGGDGVSGSIHARSFSAGGHPRAGEWPVSRQAARDDTTPDIALSNNGEFMVVWADDGMFNDILGRSFRSLPFFEDGFESGDVAAWSTSLP